MKIQWTARCSKREQALDALKRAVQLMEMASEPGYSFGYDSRMAPCQRAMYHARTAAELLRQTDGVEARRG